MQKGYDQMSWETELPELTTGTLHSFSDDLDGVPPEPGVYTIWGEQGNFLYVGRAGNLYKRLRDHRSGRRGGDQFCIYVQDRLILKTLSSETIEAISEAEESLDDMVGDYIQDRLDYRFVEVADGEKAQALEAYMKEHGLPTAGKPLFNPAG